MSVILGINISHSPSVCLLNDGRVEVFYDEERHRREKMYEPLFSLSHKVNFKSIERLLPKLKNRKIDEIIFASYDSRTFSYRHNFSEHAKDIINNLEETNYGSSFNFFNFLAKLYTTVGASAHITLDNSREKKVISSLLEQLSLPETKATYIAENHHIYHVFCSFYFSQMEDAICLVSDGGGAQAYKEFPYFQEVESVYYISNKEIKPLFKHLSNARLPWVFGHEFPYSEQKINGVDVALSTRLSPGMKFSDLTAKILNESGRSSGKTMGLAAYGNMVGDRPEDRARQLQDETRKETVELIKRAIQYKPECKNIILSGGYALNCTNNYLYLEDFPDYNIFIDPVAHDGGTAIGAALYAYRQQNNN